MSVGSQPTADALVLFGATGVVNLRILGFLKQLPAGPLHRLLPWGFAGLVINVVDLAGWTDVKCIAQATGGFYKSGAGGIDLQPMLREAAGFEGEGMCRTGK